MSSRTDIPVSALDAELDGDAIAPGDAAWDDARRAWNLAFDQQPGGRCAGRQHRGRATGSALRGRARPAGGAAGTGHGAGQTGSLDGALLLRTQGLGGVEIDPATRIARIGAGVQWRDVAEPRARSAWPGSPARRAPSASRATPSAAAPAGWCAGTGCAPGACGRPTS